MRPIDRGDMQAWLGVLQTQLSALTQRAKRGVNGTALVTTLHQGWLEKRGEHVAVGMVGGGWKRRFFVLSARQEQTGDEIELRHFLNYFKSEEQAAHVVEGGAIDLADVDEVRGGEAREVQLVTGSRVWLLRAASQHEQEGWVRALSCLVSDPDHAVSEEVRLSLSAPPVEAAAGVTSISTAELKMQVPRPLPRYSLLPSNTLLPCTPSCHATTPCRATSPYHATSPCQVPGTDGQATWKAATFELQTDGMLRWRSDEAWPWDAGAIDVKQALGVWLLGPPGWRRLDIILPEHRWTLAAEKDEVLISWVALLEEVAPEKPVSEIRNGWMEKRGAVGGGWKLRFFVLLSTHELLYFESDRSPRCKGVIDLREARSCTATPRPDYNYEYSFEVVCDKRTWVLCPDDQHAMQAWMEDIRPLIGGGGGGGKSSGGGGGRKRRKSITQKGSRQWVADEEGNVSSAACGQVGEAVVKAGWLGKRGEINTAWKQRWCVPAAESPAYSCSLTAYAHGCRFVLTAENPAKVRPRVLRYYKDEDASRSAKHGGCSAIELDISVAVSRGSDVPVHADSDHPHHCFEVATRTRTYLLCAPSAEELQEWMALLAGVGREPGGAAAGAATTERRESGGSVASCLSSGPLVEVRSSWVGPLAQVTLLLYLLRPPTGVLGLDEEEGTRHGSGQQDAEAPFHPVRQPRAALLRGQNDRGRARRR